MRVRLIPKSEVGPEQQQLYDAFVERLGKNYSSFKTMTDDGALLGPWAVWLQVPKTGEAIRQLIEIIDAMPGLKKTTVQAVVLATGAHFNAAYVYTAHGAVGKAVGLTDAQIATLTAGRIPVDLDVEGVLAVEVAQRLLQGGDLASPLYARAKKELGQDGFDHLLYTVCQYSMVSTCLNAYAMPAEYDYDTD